MNFSFFISEPSNVKFHLITMSSLRSTSFVRIQFVHRQCPERGRTKTFYLFIQSQISISKVKRKRHATIVWRQERTKNQVNWFPQQSRWLNLLDFDAPLMCWHANLWNTISLLKSTQDLMCHFLSFLSQKDLFSFILVAPTTFRVFI